MFCDKCGKELKDGDIFCESCGNKVVHEEVFESIKGNTEKNNKKLIIIGILIAIALVIAAVIVLGDRDNNSASTQMVSTHEVDSETLESTEVTKTPEVTEEEIIKVGTVEQLYDSEEYNNKKIEITGVVNFESPADGILKMYGSYSEVVAYLVGVSGYDMPFNDCMTVIGVMKKDEYGTVCIYVEYAEELGEPLDY